MAERPLRFAALIRVSTEKQEQQGESLKVQRASIERDVKALGGKVMEWYGGQEHATEGWERKELDRLLHDAGRKTRKFDAVIVAYQDRWSRDNAKNKQGLKIFKSRGIRFFIGQTGYDLFNPEHNLILGLSAEIGGFFAAQQAKKSIENRIARARRGLPSGGKKPYGRRWVWDSDRQGGKWVVDKEKKAKIQDVAKRYLAGESMPRLADEMGMNNASLWKTLTRRCGTEWEIRFHSEDFGIDETVPFKIPRLLPEEAIMAIRARAEANKTYRHGEIKNRYLLSRMILCGQCGYAMFGQTNHSTKRYYRHAHTRRVRACRVPISWLPADWFEDVILRELFLFFGNPRAVETAIQAALPDIEKAKECQEGRKRVLERIAKIGKGRDKILGLITEGILTDTQAKKKLKDLNSQELAAREELEHLETFLSNRPTEEQVRAVAKSARRRVPKAFVQRNARINVANEDFSAMSWEDKRALVESVFDGKTKDGERMGVYVWPMGTGRGNQSFRYEIRGQLINRSGSEPIGSVGEETGGFNRRGKAVSKSAKR